MYLCYGHFDIQKREQAWTELSKSASENHSYSMCYFIQWWTTHLTNSPSKLRVPPTLVNTCIYKYMIAITIMIYILQINSYLLLSPDINIPTSSDDVALDDVHLIRNLSGEDAIGMLMLLEDTGNLLRLGHGGCCCWLQLTDTERYSGTRETVLIWNRRRVMMMHSDSKLQSCLSVKRQREWNIWSKMWDMKLICVENSGKTAPSVALGLSKAPATPPHTTTIHKIKYFSSDIGTA